MAVPTGGAADAIADQAGVTVAGPSYRAAGSSTPRSPTAEMPQAKLWWQAGTWWGLLVDAPSGELRIHRLDWGSQTWRDTGVVVDERPDAHADVLAEGDTGITVVAAGSYPYRSNAVRVSRFAWDAAGDGYRLLPDYPVALSEVGGQVPVVARDTAGQLWSAWIVDGRVLVTSTSDDDHHWLPPASLPVEGASVAAGQVAITAVGGSISVAWSSQAEDAIDVALHLDGDPVDRWEVTRTPVEGLRNANDGLSLQATADGRLFLAVKTSLDTVPNPNPLDPQVLLLARGTDGTWQRVLVARLRDRWTRPIVLLDEAHRVVYVLGTSPSGGGAIYYKAAHWDDLRFPTGLGTPFIAGTANPRLNHATSTSQPVDATTGIVVLASDDSTGRYVHGALALGGPAPGSTPPGAPAAPGPVTLVADTFDPWSAGPALPFGWETRPAAAAGRAAIQASGTRGALAVTADPQGGIRACRSIPAGRAPLTLEAVVRVAAGTRTATTLLAVRGNGTDQAVVRRLADGRIVWFDGTTPRQSAARLAADSWVRVRLSIHAGGRWSMRLMTLADGVALVTRSALNPRSAVAVPDEACIGVPEAAARGRIELDALTVTREVAP